MEVCVSGTSSIQGIFIILKYMRPIICAVGCVVAFKQRYSASSHAQCDLER